MRQYQLTPNLALTVKPCRPALRWFVGKTNRLTLVSLSLCGLELNLYLARHWDYPVWDDAPEFLEANPRAAASQHRGNVVRFTPRH